MSCGISQTVNFGVRASELNPSVNETLDDNKKNDSIRI